MHTLASPLPPGVRPVRRAAAPAALEAPVELLRLSTAGSVDDGKSTLIGRLLYDTKSIYEDQLAQIEEASRRRGEGHVNLALLTDGLRAEREQNITIDVAYRYFATPRRKFIVADTPGHLQYTRNMVTGASTAELAVVLVDARKGITTQSKRHGFLASLLGIPHLVVAVNKMDLVGWSEEAYRAIVDEYRAFAQKLEVQDLTFIPISALLGDNVVQPTAHMPWYGGGTLLHHLETVNVGGTRNLVDFRLPVQYVIRPHQDFRGFAGRIASGTLAPGEEVVALPSGRQSRVRSIETYEGPLAEAAAGDSVVVTLEDEIDLSRGDLLVRRRNLPALGSELDVTLCWMGERPAEVGQPYLLQHCTRTVQALVREVVHRIDVDTLHREPAETLHLNDIARVTLTTSQPLCYDPYERNRATGGLILVDPRTHDTVAAGMIRGEVREPPAPAPAPAPGRPRLRLVSPGAVYEPPSISRGEREARTGHPASVLWFTGLSGAGKSTIARALEQRLFHEGHQTVLLDGDRLRHGLCGDLGFSEEDRRENVRRVGEVARLFFDQGSVVLCALVSPYRDDRDAVRALFPEQRFLEVHVRCSLELLRERDPKGLYARAERGEVTDLTGLGSPYQPPAAAELVLDTGVLSPDAAVTLLLAQLRARGLTR